MDISVYISELLYGNDCVIIPGFGGFVTHYAPARIHPINHSFLPPSKNILFNSKLVRDDGLLTDHIAARQGITYAEAKRFVSEYGNHAAALLAKGEVVRIQHVGTLQRDSSGKLLFSPDESINYLEEAYGLSSFVSPPIKRQSIQKRMESRFIDRKPVSGREQQVKKKYWVYAAAVPVILLLGWFILFGPVHLINTQQSGIITLPDTEQNPVMNEGPAKIDHSFEEPPLESLDLREIGSRESTIVEDAEETGQEAVPPGRKYFIIGGAFGVEANADKLVAVLRKRGYTAERAGISPLGLHMVSYFSTADKSEALVNLDIIRRQDNPSAWLIRK